MATCGAISAPGRTPLQAIDDDAFARLEAARHHAQALDRRTQGHLAIFRLAGSIDDQHEFLVLVGTDMAD